MKRIIIYLILVFVHYFPTNSFADIDTAINAYERGHYSLALNEFTELANSGNTKAQYNLAFMYYGGEGTAQDYSRAFYWFEKAAKSGYPRAQDILAYMYNHGYGVVTDRVRAYVWYSLAATNGIFLAGEIRDSLASEMGKAELAQAELLTKEYTKEFGHTSSK